MILAERIPHEKRIFSLPEQQFDTFSEYIRYHRKRLGWTQEELAEKSGISQSYVSGLERGINKEPEPDKLEGIAVGIGRPVAEVFKMAGRSLRKTVPVFVDDEPTEEIIRVTDPRTKTHVEKYDGMDEDAKDILDAVAEQLWQKSQERRKRRIGYHNEETARESGPEAEEKQE